MDEETEKENNISEEEEYEDLRASMRTFSKTYKVVR